MTISEHLNKLLFQFDCVIIPDFGGFIRENSAAYYDDNSSNFFPPQSKVLFKSVLKNNDGLLIHSLMEKDGLSYPEAVRKIQQFNHQAEKKLKSARSLILPKVGKIYMDQNDNIQFHPNKDVNYNSDSFGLPVIDAHKISPQERVDKEVHSLKKNKSGSKVFMVAASLLALCLIASLLFINQRNSRQEAFSEALVGDKMWTDLNKNQETTPIFDVTSENTTVASENEEVQNQVDNGGNREIETTLTSSEEISNGEISPTSSVEQQTITAPNDNNFHVVIGMYTGPNYAQKQYDKAKSLGFDQVQSIKGRKYTRIVIPFSKEDYSWSQALKLVRPELEPEAWIWESRQRN